MAAGYPERLRDASGIVATYTAAPNTVNHEPPKCPHPDAELVTNYSGRAILPNEKGQRLEGFLEYLRVNGGEFPVDGDKTARLRRMKCWDPLTNRGLKSYTGTEPCEEPTCPHPQPHVASQWFSDQFPRFRDIAHVLYPAGVVPTRVSDEPEPAPVPPEPEQLDMLALLEEMTS